MKIDKHNSLAELSGVDWGEPPASASFNLRARYINRRKKLKELSLSELRFMLDLNFENDAEILVSYGLNRINGLHAKDNYEAVKVLISILKNRTFKWDHLKTETSQVRSMYKNWLKVFDDAHSTYESLSDKLEFYQKSYGLLVLQNDLLASMVEWERRVSMYSKDLKYNLNSIKVLSAEKLVLSKPEMYWGTATPTRKTFIDSIKQQIKSDGFAAPQISKYDDWTVVEHESDWLQAGLKMTEDDDIDQLFNQAMVKFSDDKGAICVRVEYILYLYVNNLLLWRNNELQVLKDKVSTEVIHHLSNNFRGKTVLMFK